MWKEHFSWSVTQERFPLRKSSFPVYICCNDKRSKQFQWQFSGTNRLSLQVLHFPSSYHLRRSALSICTNLHSQSSRRAHTHLAATTHDFANVLTYRALPFDMENSIQFQIIKNLANENSAPGTSTLLNSNQSKSVTFSKLKRILYALRFWLFFNWNRRFYIFTQTKISKWFHTGSTFILNSISFDWRTLSLT